MLPLTKSIIALTLLGASVALGAAAEGAPERVVIKGPRLGAMNLMGAEGLPLMSDDLKAFTPLFGKAVDSPQGPPKCDVLLVYARIKASGEVAHSKLGLREIIRDSGAKVVIVATENSGDAYIAGAPTKGYGFANLVMTTERRGKIFAAFFARLFKMMFAGTTMPVAWVQLAPQIPGADHDDAPGTIFAAEAGQVTFR